MDRPGPEWDLPGLGANGPNDALKEKLVLFGRFVGDWDIVEARYPQPDGSVVVRKGRVQFRWILNGLAIQDIWSVLDEKNGEYLPAGTTIRFYDSAIDAWRSVWISPAQGALQTFIGRKEGDNLVLELQPSRNERWVFTNISPASFNWHAEVSSDEGRTWTVTETMTMIRIKGH